MITPIRERHAEPETVAAFAEGRLDGEARADLLEHLDLCADCTHELSLAMDALPPAPVQERSRRVAWIIAAAAAIAFAIFIPLIRNALRRSPVETLVAAAPRSARVVEPRLSGGFAWAQYAGPGRADGSSIDAERLKLGGAAGEIIERAQRDRSAEAQHAAGVAMVLIDKPAEAIATLEAVTRTRNDATAWNDLAAARYAAATALGRTSLLPQALAAANAALRVQPDMAEALFNRALILEKMGLTGEARQAWQRYLAIDASSEWAGEARARLARLPASTRSSRFERDQPLLERAAAGGDAARVRELVSTYPQQARTFAEAEYLGRWAEAAQRGGAHAQHGDAEAERWLRIARAVAAALVQTNGESLLHEAVTTIDAAPPGERATLIAGHLAYRRGRIAHSRQQVAVAERELRSAAELFATMRSPMALMARYYAASARLAQNDEAEARKQLERERTVADASPRFIAFGAHVRWELARAHMLDGDIPRALPLLVEGAAMFRRLGERANESFLESMRARALAASGRFDEAWDARVRTFAALSAEGHSDMLASSLTGALDGELRAGRNDAALALATIEIDGARPVLAIAALVQRAMLESAIGGDAMTSVIGGDAITSVARAEAMAQAIPDAALRERLLADASVARGAATRDPAAAAQALTRAIDFYRAHDVIPALPEPLLLRARTAARRGETAAALRDLEAGMAAFERHGDRSLGSGVLHVERALFTDAVALALQREDTAAAFAYAERARGGAVTLAALQQRLAGSATAVLELVTLPAEVVTFAVSAEEAAVARRGRELPLYEQMVAPVEHVLSDARRVIVVPDQPLEQVAFAAIHDPRRRQHLIERFEVAMATSATSLRPRDRRPVRTAVTMALPSGERSQTAGLPETEGELADVAAAYAATERIPATRTALRHARADVLHIAGHTAREQGAGEQALVFADGRASWKTVATLAPLQARVVVLAACETLRRPQAAETRALSLGAAFAAAGAEEVIGTLAPIPDRHARLLFSTFHRHLAAGASPAAALRATQLESLRSGAVPWKAVALLTTSV